MDFTPISIYAELDVLLDTRLATLYRLDPQKTAIVLENNYGHRAVDEFMGFDIQGFHDAYAQRDAETLKLSLLTEAHEFIDLFAVQTLKAMVSSPIRRQPKLVLNIHPYKLDDETISDILSAVVILTKNRLDVEIVDLPREEVTPDYIKREFVYMLMYDYWNWLELHAANQNLVKTQLPSVQLIGPALVRSSIALEELRGVDTFDTIEKYVAPYIKLRLFPVSKFSVDFKRAAQANTEKG